MLHEVATRKTAITLFFFLLFSEMLKVPQNTNQNLKNKIKNISFMKAQWPFDIIHYLETHKRIDNKYMTHKLSIMKNNLE